MIRDRLIYWLGGYSEKEYDELRLDFDGVFNEMVRRGDTIKELQALIPVSAVTPKKRGRPRKVDSTYIAKASEDWQKDMG